MRGVGWAERVCGGRGLDSGLSSGWGVVMCGKSFSRGRNGFMRLLRISVRRKSAGRKSARNVAYSVSVSKRCGLRLVVIGVGKGKFGPGWAGFCGKRWI